MRFIKNLQLMKNKDRIPLLLLVSFLSANNILAQPIITLTPVITSGLSEPIQLVNARDGSNRIFIVQKGGSILSYDASYNLLGTFLTIPNIATIGEQGLLSMAFHPGYSANGFFYVYYDNANGDLELARYHISGDPNVADASSKVILITIPHPTNINHNGGELHFGNDGFLYLSTGDGGGSGDVANNAQNTAVLLGKILRLNVNTSSTAPYYTIPASNPYNNEIYDLGLRNPFRWSFDRQTQDMWIGDVGENSWEEIDFRAAGTPPGLNYGWRCYEGNTAFNTSGCGAISNYDFPIHTYDAQAATTSIIGGIVYRGASYPALQGCYLAADFYTGELYKVVSDGNGGWITSTQTLTPSGISDFGETENGEAYVVSLTDNSVHRIGSSGVGMQEISSGPKPVSAVSSGNGDLCVELDPKWGYEFLEIIDMNGALLIRENITNHRRNIHTPVQQLNTGIYLLRLTGRSNTYVSKLVVP